MKAHGFVHDERDPSLFANIELDICIGVHVDDIEFVAGTLERHDNACWGVVTDKPQGFLGRSLCRTPQGYTFRVSCDYVTNLCKDSNFGKLKGSNTLSFEKPDDTETMLDESGQRRHRQLFGRLLWFDCPDINNTVCQLSTHVGTATARDEINIKRLLRYLMGNLAYNMIVGCNLDVPDIADIPQGSVVVMTDADWAGDVKRPSQLFWNKSLGKGSFEHTWYLCTRLPRSRTWFV